MKRALQDSVRERTMIGAVPEVLQLDIGKLEVGREGIEPFYFPVRHEQLREYRDALLQGCFEGLAALLPGQREEVELALVPILEFVREAMALFYAHAVIGAARADGVDGFSVPEAFALMRARIGGEVPSPRQRRTWRLLARGIPDPRWRRPLRLGRNLILRDEFSRRPPALVDMRGSIVTPAVSPLIRRHARSVPERVHLVPPRYWFQPLSPGAVAGAATHALAPEVTEVLLQAVARAYGHAGEQMPGDQREFLSRWLVEVSGLCRLYLERLLAAPARIPARLWTGTGGIIWMRLLRLACRRLGGEVTGHEHGTASGQATSISLGLWEFEFCDRFVTFTDELAKLLQREWHHRYRIGQPAPEIVSITGLEGGREPPERPRADRAVSGREIRRVMYLNTEYYGDSPGLTPAFPDPVWVDWQARLMTLLREAGFEVLLKPHPESPIHPGSNFEALADRVLWQRFEAVQEQADAFLFDWPQTTTLVQAMATSRPIVIIDFGFTVLEPEAEARLRQRCAVIPGWLDEQGRARVDPGLLREAFTEAVSKTGDREYFLRYQGGMNGV